MRANYAKLKQQLASIGAAQISLKNGMFCAAGTDKQIYDAKCYIY
jgi:hypothetical protein